MRVLPLALTGVLAVCSPAVSQVAQPAYPIGDTGGFSGDWNTLPRVISGVENASGGDVVAARYASRNGVGGFDILISKGGQLDFVRLERDGAQTRKIDMSSRPQWMLDWADRGNLRVAQGAKVPLAAAVLTAEEWEGGPALAAGIARGAANYRTDVHAYNILIRSDHGPMRRVAVDSDNGMVIDDPGALPDWP
jgi:hypothetical protein